MSSRLASWLPSITLALALALALACVAYALRRGVRQRTVSLLGLSVVTALALYASALWLGLVPERVLRFARPQVVWLGVAALAWVAGRLATFGASLGRLRRALGEAWVAVAIVAAALAAAGLEIGRPLDGLTVVVVIDRSRSIDRVPQGEQRIERELALAEASMGEADRIAAVVFAAGAQGEMPARAKHAPSVAQRAALGRDDSDLAAGIRRAMAEVPADSAARLVVLSDGVATRGDALAAAAAAAAAGIPIDVVTLEQSAHDDVRLSALRLAPRVREGETLALRAVVSSPRGTRVELRLSRDGKLVRRLEAEVDPGEDVVELLERAPGAGLHRYDVAISALNERHDEVADNNRASAFVRVEGPARALCIDGDETGFIAGALTQAGFVVEEGGLSALPSDIDGLALFDLVVFGDIAAHLLAPRQIEALASYVRDLGGGLWLTGGDRSMGPGGYARTPLEEVSPVSFDLKQEKRRASLAEVIAIDISGSMGMTVGGPTKLDLANEAAARSASLLGPGDRLGVLHVDTAATWSVALAPVDDKEAIERAIRRAGPGGGGILVDVALAAAYAALEPVEVNLKHVLLFADGDDAENITPEVLAEVTRRARAGISTSVVALGHGADLGALEELSRRGGGRYYIIEDATRLPAVFTQETILASRSALHEEAFHAALGHKSAVLRNIAIDSAPPLDGYVITIAKNRSTVALLGPEDDPLLALWSVGVGRAAAFTSDLKDRWGSAWTSWNGAAQLAAQIARDVSRGADDGRLRLEAQAGGGELVIAATLVDDDGRLDSFAELAATIRGPDGWRREVRLEASAAGSYRARVPIDRSGNYIVAVHDVASGKLLATTGAARNAGDELRPGGSDRALLARVAELSQGKERDTLAGIFFDRPRPRFGYRDAGTPLTWLAAVALLLSVGARRLALPSDLVARARAAWRKRQEARRAPLPAVSPQPATLEHLLKSKHQGRRRATPTPPPDRASADPPQEPAPERATTTRRDPPPRPPPPRGDASAAATPEGPTTSAEILLARRKRRRRPG
jgi:uncharacterized membrane protein